MTERTFAQEIDDLDPGGVAVRVTCAHHGTRLLGFLRADAETEWRCSALACPVAVFVHEDLDDEEDEEEDPSERFEEEVDW